MVDRLTKLVGIFKGSTLAATGRRGTTCWAMRTNDLMRHFATESGQGQIVHSSRSLARDGASDRTGPRN